MKKRSGKLGSCSKTSNTNPCSKQPREHDKQSLEYAVGYIKIVKDTMLKENNMGKYDEFAQVLRDSKEKRIDIDTALERMKELLKEHDDLILGFNFVLSEEQQIRLPLEDKVEFQETVNFVKKIETRFQGDKNGVYKSFLEILAQRKTSNISPIDQHEMVCFLFKDHPDLLLEFTRFIPPPSNIISRDAHAVTKISGE